MLDSRGVKDDYTFQYHGKPAVVRHEDRIMRFDKYWIQLDNRDEISWGRLISDDGKEIYVRLDEWGVRDSGLEKK
jgi:hypothetical protein